MEIPIRKDREELHGYMTMDADFANKLWEVYSNEVIPAGTLVAMDANTEKIVRVIEGIEEEKELSFEF